MSGKAEVTPNFKVTKQIRNTLIAWDLETLQELIDDNDYNLNSFTDNDKTILYFAALKNLPEEIFTFLLNKTSIETKKDTLLQFIKGYNDRLTSYIISVLQNISQTPKHSLEEKIPMNVGSTLLNKLVEKDKFDEKFIAWVINKILLDTSALEIAIKAKRYDVLSLILAEIYKTGGKKALPSLNAYLSEAIKNNEAECVKLLLLYGGIPNIDDIEAVRSLKTFVVLAQFGHVAGRYLKLSESIGTLNTELKSACLVGTYNNDKLFSAEEISAILDANDLIQADSELMNSMQHLLARVLTDWSYWFKALDNPLDAYEKLQSENADAVDHTINIFKAKNENRLKSLIPFLTEKLTNNRNQTLKSVIENYKDRFIPSLQAIALEATIALINASDDATAELMMGKLPHSYLDMLKADNRLKYQLVALDDNDVNNNQGDLAVTVTTTPINKDILLAFIKRMDSLLDAIEKHIGLKNAASIHMSKFPVGLVFGVIFTIIGVLFNTICLAIFAITAGRNDGNAYNPKSGIFPVGVMAVALSFIGIVFLVVHFSLSIANLIAQDVNKLFNKKDMALYLAAIADYYQLTSPNETAALAELAVQLYNNPGNFRTTRILKEAKVILDKLNVDVTEDLPLNYKPVTVYPNSQNIVRLGDLRQHLTLFPLAQGKIKQVSASETTHLLSRQV